MLNLEFIHNNLWTLTFPHQKEYDRVLDTDFHILDVFGFGVDVLSPHMLPSHTIAGT
jgi:hypothetical protein